LYIIYTIYYIVLKNSEVQTIIIQENDFEVSNDSNKVYEPSIAVDRRELLVSDKEKYNDLRFGSEVNKIHLITNYY
jgi:hypothetical protein